ncbi:Cop1-interacting protein [Thalictrum thalictroides]|uniref:Cop1-interacting protein n=1 Tax=Thalictrum thalictroides TaxID=46969 RepID=A0A7J6VTV8_THATH|nr:Cop1-interacting protein [Thalictrum thalictroides]
MKSRTRLDSAVFQLTPTRTRYNLVINANGETEKISSGLLNPFLTHLKAVQDQVARGCYSIMLEPSSVNDDAIWFTKGTVERFVRFVNSPEVLERVNMTESEILQIEEAIAIHSKDTLRLKNVDDHIKVEDYGERSQASTEGFQPKLNADAEDTILVYKIGAHYINSSGPGTQENSKVHFVRVLETRKAVLRKEQGMAFARAIAAGFDINRMVHLISFAECFGAPRLMEACLGFMVLWKEQHETDQWFEIEATEAMPSQSDTYSNNNYYPMTNETKKHDELKETWSGSNGRFDMQGKGNARNGDITDMIFDCIKDEGTTSHREFCQPLQGVDYVHMEGAPFSNPHNIELEVSRVKSTKSVVLKRHLVDNTESETCETDVSCMRPHDSSELVKQCKQGDKWRKAGRTGRKKSGMVVIDNLTYVSSERKHLRTNGKSQFTSDSENDKEAEDVQESGLKVKKNKSVGSTKNKKIHSRHTAAGDSYDNEDIFCGKGADSGNWQVFQNILLQHNNDDGEATNMFAQEKEDHVKRQHNNTGADLVVPCGGDPYKVQDMSANYYYTDGGKRTHLLSTSSDELVRSHGQFGTRSNDCSVDVHFTKLGGRGGYRKVVNDGSVIYEQKTMSDESFILPLRLSSQDQIETDRRAINMDADIPSKFQKKENISTRVRSQLNYEPDDLRLMPVRESIGNDPAVDYKVEAFARNDNVLKRIKEESVTGVNEMSKKLDKNVKSKVVHNIAVRRKNEKELKLVPLNEGQGCGERRRSLKADLQKIKITKEEEERKRLEALKRERQKRITARSCSGPAQSTLSSQMRSQLKPKKFPSSYKSTNFNNSEPMPLSPLQKLPNRTPSLGSTGSENITRPGNLNKASPSQSKLPSHMRAQNQTKISLVSYKGSKFSDSEPGPSSPLQRLRRRAASLGSNGFQKITSPSGLSGQHASIKSTRSVSSHDLKKNDALVTPKASVSAARIQRPSDPKIRNRDHVSFTKLGVTNSLEPKVGVTVVRRLSEPEASNEHHVSSIKLQSALSTNLKAPDGSGVQKNSTIVSEGRIKAAASPIMKTLKFPSVMEQNKTQEMTLKNNPSSITPEVMDVHQSNTRASHNRNGEEKRVIETTVVLENEIPLLPVIQVSGERTDTIEEPSNEHEFSEQIRLEDPCTPKSEYTKVPRSSSEMAIRVMETVKTHAPKFIDSNSLDKTPGSIFEPRVKAPSKGIRRILKFGRAMVKHNVPSDRLINKGSVVDSCVASTASSNAGNKTEQRGFRRATMSHALYIA